MPLTAVVVLAGAVFAVVMSGSLLSVSAVEPTVVSGAADATEVADRLVASGGLVSISQPGGMTSAVASSATAAAASVGALAAESSGYSIGMAWVRRGDIVVQQPNAGAWLWQYPMSATVLPVHALASLMGAEVQLAVAGGSVVMGETTAAMRGARAGDTIGLVAAGGEVVGFTVGAVAPDAVVGGTEIVMSPAQAEQLGATEITRVLVYGSFSRAALDAALSARGLVDGGAVRIVHSWDPRSPDAPIGMLRTKQLLGEFAYSLTGSGSSGVAIDPAWIATRLPADRILYDRIGIRARCHRAIEADLQAALADVAAAGLAAAIDVSNTNTFGGCYNPRFNRLSGNLGFLSRHAWAQAIDMNTTTNAQGRTPQMDCRVVRIFRSHNFAWGGNFLTPDGMHFEWVGEPRHTLQYPSRYCPNEPSIGIESLASAETTARDTMFAGDGWTLSLGAHD